MMAGPIPSLSIRPAISAACSDCSSWPLLRPDQPWPGRSRKSISALPSSSGRQRHHLVVKIGASAVNEDNGRKRGTFGRRDVDVMQPDAVDVSEGTYRRVAPLDQPGVGARHDRQHQKQCEQESERGGEKVHDGQRGPVGAGLRCGAVRCLRPRVLRTASPPRSGRCASSDRCRERAAMPRAQAHCGRCSS